jgi:hypothetical protein
VGAGYYIEGVVVFAGDMFKGRYTIYVPERKKHFKWQDQRLKFNVI